MNKGGLFWGGMLIVLGVLFMLNILGILPVNVWTLFWPLALIALGIWVLSSAFGRDRSNPQSRDEEPAGYPEVLALELKGVESARISLQHGGGRLVIDSDAAPDELLSGTFQAGVDCRFQEDIVEHALVELRSPPGSWTDSRSWAGRDWHVSLNREVPLELSLQTGASEMTADLSATSIGNLKLQTGAARSSLILPAAAGHVDVLIEGGLASITLRIPDGTAAHVASSAGAGTVSVDESRFPREHGNLWQSPDYETADNRVNVTLRVGAGDIEVV